MQAFENDHDLVFEEYQEHATSYAPRMYWGKLMITKAFMDTGSCAKLIIVITKYQHNIRCLHTIQSAKCDETKYDR